MGIIYIIRWSKLAMYLMEFYLAERKNKVHHLEMIIFSKISQTHKGKVIFLSYAESKLYLSLYVYVMKIEM